MRIPRMSLAEMMFGMAILAFDLATFVLLGRYSSWYSWECRLVLMTVPLLNALLAGLVVAVRRLAARREVRPFVVGFEAAGWPALIIAAIVAIILDKVVNRYERWAVHAVEAFWSAYIMWTGEFTYKFEDSLQSVFQALALAGPPLLAALLGGIIAELLGVTIVRADASSDRRRAIPARRAAAVLAAFLIVLGCTGWWSVTVCHRWLTYRELFENAIASERYYRESHVTLLEQPQIMEKTWQFSNPEEKETQLARVRQQADEALRLAERFAAWQVIYGPASRRPWLPIPPNPPLDPSELKLAP